MLRANAMKTTVELPDDLYRRAKAEAALRGRKLKDMIEEGLQLVLDRPRKTQQAKLVKLIKRASGIMESGIPDLGSNPKHLENLGRDDRDR
jgi:hypothetical protein